MSLAPRFTFRIPVSNTTTNQTEKKTPSETRPPTVTHPVVLLRLEDGPGNATQPEEDRLSLLKGRPTNASTSKGIRLSGLEDRPVKAALPASEGDGEPELKSRNETLPVARAGNASSPRENRPSAASAAPAAGAAPGVCQASMMGLGGGQWNTWIWPWTWAGSDGDNLTAATAADAAGDLPPYCKGRLVFVGDLQVAYGMILGLI
jgi:hypothetical protein